MSLMKRMQERLYIRKEYGNDSVPEENRLQMIGRVDGRLQAAVVGTIV